MDARQAVTGTAVARSVSATLAVALVGIGCAAEAGDGYLHYRIKHDGMRPTYSLGDGVVSVDSAAYRSAAPRVGDILLFHAPWDGRPAPAARRASRGRRARNRLGRDPRACSFE